MVSRYYENKHAAFHPQIVIATVSTCFYDNEM